MNDLRPQKALAKMWEMSDANYFRQYPDRKVHIRNAYKGECDGEFWSLGPHEQDRRRIILYRVPKENPMWDPKNPQVLKIPFLAFADETIEDRDDILLPILHEIMVDKAKKHTR
jgi:hypothetical protein